MATVVTSRDCIDCGVSHPESEFLPSHLKRTTRIRCAERHRERQRELARARGVRPRRALTPEQREARGRANQEWYAQNPDARRRYDLKKYGITPEDYDRILAEQGGVCAACKKPERRKNTTYLHVDHDHQTGEVRGLLCCGCNFALGYMLEDPESIEGLAAYARERCAT